jgi:hypothetical protein
MNLNMLRTAIQGLEMQKSGLEGITAAMQQAMQTGLPEGSKDKKP